MIRAGQVVFLCVLSLLCIGVVMVSSAGMSVADGQQVTFETIVFSRSTAYMLIAVAVMLAVGYLPITRLAEWSVTTRWTLALIPLMVLGLLTVYTPLVGHEVKGSSRWIKIPGLGLTMQPSEIAKWGMIVLVSWYCIRKADVLHKFKEGLLPALIGVGVLAAMVIKEDLGTGVLILAMSTVVLIGAGARIWHFAAMMPVAALGLGAAVLAAPYRVKRVLTFLDPYSDPEGRGYHGIQSLVSIANGKLFGRGLGFGLQKFGYLPEDKTDFLFAVICEELGLIGATLVIVLYLVLLVAGWRIVKRQQSAMLKLVGLGVLSTVGIQAIINLLVVTGLAPTKGIALPLLSSGGTGWILTAASLGLIVAMDRNTVRDAAGVPITQGQIEAKGISTVQPLEHPEPELGVLTPAA